MPFFLFLSGSGAFSQVTLMDVPKVPSDDFSESAEVRVQIAEAWLEKEIDAVLLSHPGEYRNRAGQTFVVSAQREADTGFAAISVVPVEKKGVQGTWTLYRRLSDGMPDHIRIYPLPDPSIFINIRPNGDKPEKGKTLLELNIYGAWACRDIPLGVPFIRMYTNTFESIVALTPRLVPWYLLSPDSLRYAEVESAVAVIRDQLSTLVFLDDGAFNEKGVPVHIKDGSPQTRDEIFKALAQGQNSGNIVGGVNCSGFAKWIVDGIIRPVAGSRMKIDPLKTQTASPENHFTDPFRENNDLFFALDWTRNLAAAVVSLTEKQTVLSDAAGINITSLPFTGIDRYEMNVGYRTESILPLLYYLSVNETGHFYLGAVSDVSGELFLRAYHHVVAFFPYFDQNGQFQVVVFESAVETPVWDFINANRGSYINLVRLRLPEAGHFKP